MDNGVTHFVPIFDSLLNQVEKLVYFNSMISSGTIWLILAGIIIVIIAVIIVVKKGKKK